MSRGRAAIFAFALLFLPRAARAGSSMGTANNLVTRDVDNGGGTYSATANNQLTGSAAEEVAATTSSTSNNLLRSGFSTIASYPGTLASLTPRADVSASSVTLNWATPGYDGNLGAALGGSAYLIQVASAVSLGNFANLNVVTVTVSTSAQAVGKVVGAGATGLDPNTTYYAQVFLRDDDGDVSGAFTTDYATFTTLAAAPTVGALEFLSVQWSSVAVAWIAPYQLTVASQTNEGYVLQASSNDFGALAPSGAPVISSMTYSVLATTLTVGAAGVPLDLSNTYYFQVASLNWAGQTNYTTLGRLNFQILQSTGLINLGAINPAVAMSTVSTSSMVVTNVGNWPTTILLASTVTAASPWRLSTSSGAETGALQGVFNAGTVPPPPSLFNTFLTTNVVISQAAGNYSGGQNGYQIPVGGSVTLWFQYFLPTTTVSLAPETIQVTSQPVYP